MGLTLAGLFAKYGPRLGPYVGLADLAEAVNYALNELGSPPAVQGAVADSDLGAVAARQFNQLDDLVIARSYETILNNLTDDLLREAGIKEKAADLRPLFEKRLAKLEAKLKDQYGVGLPTPTAGVISLNFASQGDDTIECQ